MSSMDCKIHFLFCYCIYYCAVSVLCERGGEGEGGRENRRRSMHMEVRGQLSSNQFSPSMTHSKDNTQVIRHVQQMHLPAELSCPLESIC